MCCEVCNLSQRPVISCEDRYNRKSVISRDLLYREVCYGRLLYREFFIWLVHIARFLLWQGSLSSIDFISWICKGLKNIVKIFIFLSNSLVPVVASVSGPVFCEAVGPWCLVHLNSPSFKWNHWQNPCWKSHGHIEPPERESIIIDCREHAIMPVRTHVKIRKSKAL